MKRVLQAALALLLAFVAVGYIVGTPLVGEVVTLHTREAGEWQTTPLWIVEASGSEYLRAGDPNSGWVLRLRADPGIRLERGGEPEDIALAPAPEMQSQVNELMASKYGWADDFVSLMGNRGSSLPFRVERTPAT